MKITNEEKAMTRALSRVHELELLEKHYNEELGRIKKKLAIANETALDAIEVHETMHRVV